MLIELPAARIRKRMWLRSRSRMMRVLTFR